MRCLAAICISHQSSFITRGMGVSVGASHIPSFVFFQGGFDGERETEFCEFPAVTIILSQRLDFSSPPLSVSLMRGIFRPDIDRGRFELKPGFIILLSCQ